MATRKTILKHAKTWLGTPYQHQAMVKGVAVDCAMLIAGIAKDCGIKIDCKKIPPYTTQWFLHNREELLKDIMVNLGFKEIPLKDAKAGDVLGFKYGRVMSHLGIKSTNDKLIQASAETNMVTESHYDDMKSHLIAAYRFPNGKL